MSTWNLVPLKRSIVNIRTTPYLDDLPQNYIQLPPFPWTSWLQYRRVIFSPNWSNTSTICAESHSTTNFTPTTQPDLRHKLRSSTIITSLYVSEIDLGVNTNSFDCHRTSWSDSRSTLSQIANKLKTSGNAVEEVTVWGKYLNSNLFTLNNPGEHESWSRTDCSGSCSLFCCPWKSCRVVRRGNNNIEKSTSHTLITSKQPLQNEQDKWTPSGPNLFCYS